VAPVYAGPAEPTVRLNVGGNPIWVYRGNVTYACVFADPALDGSTRLELWSTTGATSEYGIGRWLDTSSFVGFVPADATSVTVTGPHGASVTGTVSGGVFLLHGTEAQYDWFGTKIVASAPTKIYTILLDGTITATNR
jgi:hypothetical protein